MKTTFLLITLAALLASTATAKDNPTAESTLTPEPAEAKYLAVIGERSQKIVDALDLSDTNAAARVHGIIMAQYRALNDWHNTNDAKIKAAKGDQETIAQVSAPLKQLHAQYLAQLALDLTPEQVEIVKDKMTYGKVQFTYKGYLIEYPSLNEEQKAEVLRLLKEAREEAMDGGSSDEKSAIFNRYKGKINNYLSKQGIHPAKKEKKSQPESSPSNK